MTNGTARPFYSRKSFAVNKSVRSALVRVTGLGQFNLWLNGEKVSKDILEPGWTDYNKTVQYVEYDVTDLLRSGGNAIGVEVGNGWYIWDNAESHGYSFHFPPFMPPNPKPYKPFGPFLVASLCLSIDYTDGTAEMICTDESWKTRPHAVVWSNVYGSEYMDGSRCPGNWTGPDCSDEGWEQARLVSPENAPKGKLTLRTQPPIRVIKEYPAKHIGTVDGVDVYDLGQNISSILSGEVMGEAGTVVSFRPAEKLDGNGLPDQMAKNWMPIDNVISYRIAESGKWERFSQVFTYFSGRYIAVTGEAKVRNLTDSAITSAWKQSGTFTFDDKRYQAIYDTIERTVEANLLSVHTDCPTI